MAEELQSRKPEEEPRQEKVSRVRAAQQDSIRTVVRILLALYLTYIIYTLIKGYRSGENDMSFPVLAAVVAVFGIAICAVAVLTVRQLMRMMAEAEKETAGQPENEPSEEEP